MPEHLPERNPSSSTAHWDSFRELEQITERMRRLLDQTFAGVGFRTSPVEAMVGWIPRTDVIDEGSAYVVEVELPGLSRDAVEIELTAGELVISGESSERSRPGTVRVQGRPTGPFELRVELPGPLDADHVEASLTDGVLTVRVPKAPRAEARRIEVPPPT